MNAASTYLLDSDVFITAKNKYYAFDICPGFWNSLIHHSKQGRIHSIDRVKNEILSGRKTEDLVQWVSKKLPSGFFFSADSEKVASAFSNIMLWVQQNAQYYDHAKAKFATGADGWLVAYAMISGAVVVTNEQSAPESKSEIKLPDVCTHFNVTYKDIFFVLRDLKIQFDFK